MAWSSVQKPHRSLFGSEQLARRSKPQICRSRLLNLNEASKQSSSRSLIWTPKPANRSQPFKSLSKLISQKTVWTHFIELIPIEPKPQQTHLSPFRSIQPKIPSILSLIEPIPQSYQSLNPMKPFQTSSLNSPNKIHRSIESVPQPTDLPTH